MACLALLAACAPSGDGAVAAGGAEGGHGIVILSPDPAHAAFTPEELEALPTRTYYHDFGSVALGDTLEHAFPIRNTDPVPVAITRMQAKCGCTFPEVRYVNDAGELVRSNPRGKPVIVLPPGQEASLIVRVDTSLLQRHQHNIDQLATVQVATDSDNKRFFQLEAHYLPVIAFQATPMPIDLGRISRNAGGIGQTDLVRTGAVDASVVGVGETPPDLRASVREENLFGSPLWVVEVELVPPLKPGPLHREFEILTENHDGTEPLPVRAQVIANVVEDVDWDPLRLVARPESPGGLPGARMEVFSHVPGHRFLLGEARLEGQGTDQIDVAVHPVSRDPSGKSPRWRVILTTRSAPADAWRGRVHIPLDDPARPEISFDYAVFAN